MNKSITYFQHERHIFYLAALASLLISLFVAQQTAIINPDAICYLQSAQALSSSSINDAMHLCGQAKWPFYSMLIYSTVKLTHFSYLTSAYVLDALFSLASVLFFILIVKELGGTKRVLWLAAFVILFSQSFVDVRQYIIRDHGFWAAYLASILFLVQFFQEPKWTAAFAWNASILIATLFRIEGVIFLVIVPVLTCILVAPPQRFRSMFMLNLPNFLIVFCLMGWLIIHPKSLAHLGRIREVIEQIQSGLQVILTSYQDVKASLTEYLNLSPTKVNAGQLTIVFFTAWYLVSLISNLSWAYLFLLIYALWHKITFTRSAVIVLCVYMFVNFIITSSFLYEHMFMSKRYLIAFSLVLMLWVPFAIYDIIQRAFIRTNYRIFLILAIAVIFLSAIGEVFYFGYSKAYVNRAGHWLARNVPAESSLYANDYQLMYYSKHFGNDIFSIIRKYENTNLLKDDSWKNYDYVALRIRKKREKELTPLLQNIHLSLIQVFSNQRGDRVVIYKNNGETA